MAIFQKMILNMTAFTEFITQGPVVDFAINLLGGVLALIIGLWIAGMAMSGTLQNFAGGVLLLILKPFKTGEFIEAQGFMGTVNEIQIFNTILITPDNKKILIPNGGLATNAITNFSARDTRRVQWVFGIAYGDSYTQAKEGINIPFPQMDVHLHQQK